MDCTTCGHALAADARFCTQCGARAALPAAPALVFGEVQDFPALPAASRPGRQAGLPPLFPQEPAAGGAAPWIVAVLLAVLLLAAAGGWWWWRARDAGEPAVGAQAVESTAAAPAQPEAQEAQQEDARAESSVLAADAALGPGEVIEEARPVAVEAAAAQAAIVDRQSASIGEAGPPAAAPRPAPARKPAAKRSLDDLLD